MLSLIRRNSISQRLAYRSVQREFHQVLNSGWCLTTKKNSPIGEKKTMFCYCCWCWRSSSSFNAVERSSRNTYFWRKKESSSSSSVLLTYRWSSHHQCRFSRSVVKSWRQGTEGSPARTKPFQAPHLLFSSLLFPSLLLRTLHGDGRAATVRDCETNSHHRPPMPASSGWMDELDGWMGEWMNGWIGQMNG